MSQCQHAVRDSSCNEQRVLVGSSGGSHCCVYEAVGAGIEKVRSQVQLKLTCVLSLLIVDEMARVVLVVHG